MNFEPEQNRGGKKSPHKKSFDFNCYRKNTIKSLYEIEYFLNNLSKFSKCFRLYKLLK